MTDKNLFEFVKGILGAPQAPAQPVRPNGPRPNLPARAPKQPDPDATNPATILRVGRSNDGRDLIMTLGFGTFLVDRETPTICFFNRGEVKVVPTPDLQSLYEFLMAKRGVGEFAAHYVDLLNVAVHEMEARKLKKKQAAPGQKVKITAPPPPPMKPRNTDPAALMPDAENPATILRVGKSHNDAELVMTLGLGTFVVHREEVSIRYYDRGREWDVPDVELQVLIDALMAKREMKEYQFTYIDLLNVATFVQQKRRSSRLRT